MTNLNNVLDKLAQNKAVQNYLNEAREKYAQKPFALEYKATYEVIKSYGFIPSSLSIASTSLVAVSLFPQLQLWLSILIGLTVATGFEILKEFTTRLGFRQWFKNKGSRLILIASIGLYLVSVALSSFGTYNAYQLAETTAKQSVSSLHSYQADSLNSLYSRSILEAKNQAKQYFEQVSWKGKISHKNAQTYNLMLDKVNRLELEYKQAMEVLAQSETSETIKAGDKVKPYLFILISFALINEFIIFIFARFKEYYLFKSNLQVDLIKQSDNLVISLDNLGSLAHLLQLNQPQQTILEGATNTIGFKVSQTPVQGEKKETRSSNRSTTVSSKDALAPRDCLKCGKEYKPSVAWQKYCSKSCNHSANNFKLKE